MYTKIGTFVKQPCSASGCACFGDADSSIGDARMDGRWPSRNRGLAAMRRSLAAEAARTDCRRGASAHIASAGDLRWCFRADRPRERTYSAVWRSREWNDRRSIGRTRGIFFGDERCVPHDDPRSNYRSGGTRSLFEPAEIAADQIFSPFRPTSRSPAQACGAITNRCCAIFSIAARQMPERQRRAGFRSSI